MSEAKHTRRISSKGVGERVLQTGGVKQRKLGSSRTSSIGRSMSVKDASSRRFLGAYGRAMRPTDVNPYEVQS